MRRHALMAKTSTQVVHAAWIIYLCWNTILKCSSIAFITTDTADTIINRIAWCKDWVRFHDSGHDFLVVIIMQEFELLALHRPDIAPLHCIKMYKNSLNKNVPKFNFFLGKSSENSEPITR